jgi:ATP-binding cassette subfamily B protein
MLRRLLALGRRQVRAAAGASALRLLVAAADVALLALLRRFLDAQGGIALAASALALGAARAGLAAQAARLEARAEAGFVGELRERVFAHLQALPLAYHRHASPGDLLSRLFHDVETAARLLTPLAGALLEVPVRLLLLTGLLLSLDARRGAVVALLVVPGALAARWLARGLRRRSDALYAELAALHDRARESLAGAELVRSFGAEARECAAFAARSRGLVAREVELLATQAAAGSAGQLLGLLAVVATLAWGAGAVARGETTAGALGAFLAAALAFLGALQALFETLAGAAASRAAAARVLALLAEPPPPAPSPGRPASFREALRFEDVTLAVPGRARPVLAGVSFALRRGEAVALVGATGSGKTTLLRLALRLLDPSSGRVTLDGADLRELELGSVRSLFAVVPQDGALFAGTIRDNLAFGRPAAQAAEIEAAVRAVGLAALLGRLPEGLDTPISAAGSLLSTGERQRLALARVALRDAPLLLLDEPTSALDAVAEAEVDQALARLASGRSLLLVTHRLRAAARASRILVLEAGRLVQDGGHAELLAADGPYRRLWEALEGERRGASQPQANSGE